MEQEKDIIVGMGEIAVSHNPRTLSALGLGSCVGVALYDKESLVGGLAHVMLPKSSEFSGIISKDRDINSLLKYADIAIPKMVDDMVKIGAKKANIHAKIAGGAQMFEGLQNDVILIGQRNINEVKRVLKYSALPRP